jgi:CheY-like chemotaxis protein
MPQLPAVSGRILIVDDEERQRSALAAMLADCAFETQFAADGQEALERLATFTADVIVADLVMPRMDGFELLRHLKERGDLTPAIALTVSATWRTSSLPVPLSPRINTRAEVGAASAASPLTSN